MRLTAVLAVTTAACSGAALPPDAAPDATPACPAPTPDLSSCFVGYFFADCGGTAAAPVLACAESDGCRWFAGACAPADHQVSPCPADDICCLDNWPFPDHEEVLSLYDRLYGLGREPWDRQRAMTIPVTIDAALAEGDPTYTCSGDDGISATNDPCNGFPGYPAARMEGTLVIEAPSWATAGWHPFIEVDPDTLLARVCLYEFTDVVESVCPPKDSHCATSGSVTLSAVQPATLSIRFDVQFPNGFALAGGFLVP